MYTVNATAFDSLHVSTASLQFPIFAFNCSMPTVSIPGNFTNLNLPQMMPTYTKSSKIGIQSTSAFSCWSPNPVT
jgi:hypothetical protein